MKKFTLTITSHNLTHKITINDPFPFGFHQNLQIIDFHADFLILCQLLFKHQNSLTNISIIRSAEWDMKNFIQCFGAMHKLKRLSLEDCQMSELSEKIVMNFETFPLLEEIKIVRCNFEVEKVFNGIKVRKFGIL